ncbi:MAG: KUP/HAK/KT family potassium transporter [Deltaproteobacteria bacterium]|nr:KUP/HAK/KT family potassium transporter [Deltaproteobacteria bacterium]
MRSSSHTRYAGGDVRQRTGLLALGISALGVVYGDIGTSPLYALKETFFGGHPLARNPENVLGVLSLIFWTLLLIVGIKYVLLVLRADFHGEGGIFALLGIIREQQPQNGKSAKLMWIITTAVMIGAASLYGESVITPAISVLSAYEGLEVVTAAFKPLVIWLTVITLLLLFLFQSRGTARVSRVFGPIMVVWFVTIGVAGLYWIIIHPSVLWAVNPLHALRFFAAHSIRVAFVLGAVVLVITGVEALYADVGHFGRKAIQVSWYSFVFPCLLLNYFGQGARLLDGAPIPNNHLFYALFPQHELVIYTVVALATAATVIASQALISGAFSMTRQGIALGFFPRVQIFFTSAEIEGQIYIPTVNWLLLAGCLLLVFQFETSSALAAAYGIAVTGTMAITSFIFYFAARGWGWKRHWVGPACLGFLLIDLSYFSANTLKFVEGGYVPIVIALFIFYLMQTWQWGRAQLALAFSAFMNVPIRHYLDLKQQIMDSPHLRAQFGARSLSQVERAIVFMTSRPVLSADDPCPMGLRIYIRRNGAIPKHIILLNVTQMSRPVVPEAERCDIIQLGAKIIAINVRYGYMQPPNVPALLRMLKNQKHIKINEKRWTIQVGEEEILIDSSLGFFRSLMLRFFTFVMRFTNSADRYFGLRQFAGRNKTVIPVVIGRGFARVTVLDDEPVYPYPDSAASHPS